jgi:hypothetical protein
VVSQKKNRSPFFPIAVLWLQQQQQQQQLQQKSFSWERNGKKWTRAKKERNTFWNGSSSKIRLVGQ